MKAEQVWPAISSLLNQLENDAERKKLENKILGAVESYEKGIARLNAELDKIPRYRIPEKKPRKKKS